ncbi:MAG TPA: redox-sensing transcriptional repressor Rex [Anaerohalosphaeraceae bacterium]|nr:redox-sensing transcriptional repressor Rex [Anaerohalosphaeraceae bacterium]HOL87695.1 redox-sensing transcriptional repressor Rex [Anaerohalosphaeraceae bacterium]HPP55798.1 redox-sensing transcriptional repressor Rex [Anaerohalosphaeraceae bacterium]
MKYRRIPDETIQRLPMYLRGFSLLEDEKEETVSSRRLAVRLGLNPHQIRKDLSYFGSFGRRGVGYPVRATAQRIRRILKLDKTQKAALIGAGRLGTALVAYPGFSSFNLEIAAIFDKDPQKIGKKIGHLRVESIERLSGLRKRKIQLAILAVPAEAAQSVTEKLVKAGVKGLLNFSPGHLKVPASVKKIDIDLASQLSILPYYL